VLHPQILVLAGVVLVGLHDPHRRVAQVVERPVVATAPEAVQAIDHHHVQVRHVAVGDAVDVAGQVARGRVDLAAGEATGPGLLGGLGHPGALGEHARAGVVDHPGDAAGVADHVVVEHRLDAPAVVLGVLCQDPAAEQTLLLAGQCGVDDAAVEAVPAQDAGGLQRARDAGGVVVGARRIGGGVHHIGGARVDVAAHDHVAARVRTAALDGDDAGDHRRLGDPGFAGNRVADRHDFQAAATGGGNTLELGLD